MGGRSLRLTWIDGKEGRRSGWRNGGVGEEPLGVNDGDLTISRDTAIVMLRRPRLQAGGWGDDQYDGERWGGDQ